MRRPAALCLPVLLSCALGLTACADDGPAASASAGAAAAAGTIAVAAALYPLQYLAERIGGQAVSVENLTAPGAEPHDLELSPQQVAALGEDDLVLYLRDFQPAVDEAVGLQAEDAAFDVGTVTPLEPDDPHVWLEPLRYATIGEAVAERMGELVPDRADEFTANAAALRTELAALDEQYRAGLADCERRSIVTSHDAYGYLAGAYDLEQVSLTGLTPEDEASPATLAEVADYARANGVTTIFFEEVVSPAVAETVAAEVGAEAVALSPLEGAPESGDYLTQMRANLTTLQTALGCSTA